jgi:hypothetical protein
MAAPSIDETVDIPIDIFGQQILPIYTQICFGFPVKDAQSYPRIVDTLDSALNKIYAQFPWLSSHVINDGATGKSSGVSKIRVRGNKPRLFVKDLRDESCFPTMEALRVIGFLIDALDEDFIAPCKTLINASESSSPEVFLA